VPLTMLARQGDLGDGPTLGWGPWGNPGHASSSPDTNTHLCLQVLRSTYISPAISHADLGPKAVRWLEPPARAGEAHGSAAAQPENDHGASRLFHAPAVGGWRSFRPSGPPLEPEDGGIHLRHPQQHPHHRPCPVRPNAPPRAPGGERYGRQG